MDQATVSDGIGGVISGVNGVGQNTFGSGVGYSATGDLTTYLNNVVPWVAGGTIAAAAQFNAFTGQLVSSGGSLLSVRQKYIQGVDNTEGTYAGNNIGTIPNSECKRRYQVKLAFGLFQQEKLIPLKWMASQLTLELTLAPAASCIFQRWGAAGSPASYTVTNVNYIPEILEFDASYDAMFLKGLREGGVPIKFASWHRYIQTIGGQSQVSFPIQERARSVKSIFTVQRRGSDILSADSGAAFFSTGATNGGTLQSYQYRIGGRYFPATPVQTSLTLSGTFNNGGSEAFTELQKALNTLGDNRLSTNVDTFKWCSPYTMLPNNTTAYNFTWFASSDAIALQEADYSGAHFRRLTAPAEYATLGQNNLVLSPCPYTNCSPIGSSCFAMAVDLETSNGVEISGLNAEEQSDITLIANYSQAQSENFQLEAYVYYDAMIVLRENNVLELIQ
jgi:hypothetical protein